MASPPDSNPIPDLNTKADAETKSSSQDKISQWLWPTEGEILRKFATSLHKGIDISGREGDPIVATAGGRVVYAGIGISGFGNL